MKIKVKTARLVAVALSVAALATGCSSTAGSPSPSTSAATTAPSVVPASTAPSVVPASAPASPVAGTVACPQTTKKNFTVAMIRWQAGDIFFNGVQLGEQIEHDRIEKDCGVTITWKLFAANDVTQQINALQADLAAGVDGVDIVPWKGAAFTDILTQLNAKQMPVVVHNANVPGAPQTFVAFDNVKAGEIAGQAAVNALDAARGQGWRQKDGVFIELRCIITASFDIGRHTGYHNIVDPIATASGGKIKVETREVTCDDSKGRQAADDIISRYGQDKIFGVLAIDGDSGFGAESALESRGMAKPKTDPAYIPVVAVDGSEAEMTSMAQGKMLTAAEQPAIAEGIIVERLLFQQMATGQLLPTPTADGTYDVPDYVGAPWLPVKLTTSPDFTGPWYQTQAFDTASIPLDDHWHWANIIDQSKTGNWPHYTDQGCVSGCPAG